MLNLHLFSIRVLAMALGVSSLVLAQDRPLQALTTEQRGDILMAQKKFREAIAMYKEGPRDSPSTWNKVGIAWHHLGELKLARQNYEQALKVNKRYAEAINNTGTIYYSEKKYGTAITRYRRALALEPDNAAFWSNLGTAYFARGKFKDMLTAYSKAMELDPDVFEHVGLVGSQVMERTVGDRARYHFEIARLYAKMAKNDMALQYLRKCLEEGFKDREQIAKAPEFAGMLENPEFKIVLAMEPRVL